MQIMKIDIGTGEFHEYAKPQDWLRIVVNGRRYDLKHATNGGLEISTEDSLKISPRASNSIHILD